jgi:serine/threonine protein kinase
MGGGFSNVAPKAYEVSCDFNKYQINYRIGRGVSSCVAHATDKANGGYVALKRINLTTISTLFSLEQLAELSMNELRTFKRVGTHPFVVSLHAAFHSHSSCYLAMDYLGGRDLRRYLKKQGRLDEKCVTYIIGCIGSALHHLHCQGVVHRDLKPENIAFDLMGRPYLTDFGISVVSSEGNPIPICNSSSGTMVYMAPETLTPTHLHSHQSDFWSLGVLAYELLFQQRPFNEHCPIPFVQFCADEYSPMWTNLVSLPIASPLIDFETTFIESKQQLVVNKSHREAVDLDSFLVPFPENIDPISVSEEFSSMLNGLLNVRIHERLGNVNKYSQFSDHPLFRKHQFVLSQLHRIFSPLSSSMEEHYPSSASILGAVEFDDEADLPFSDDLREILSEFHFLRPKVTTGDNCSSRTAPTARLRTESVPGTARLRTESVP